jgi:PA14 domain
MMQIQTMIRVAMAIIAAWAAILIPAEFAQAGPLSANITYFSISSSDPDANHLCCSGPLPEVLNTLGPDSLPLLIPGFTSGGNAPQDVNSAGELTYWSPSFDTHVTQGITTTVSLPFNDSTMYNPDGTGSYDGGSNGFLSAIISATLIAPTAETIMFTVSSDDNAFVYLDGQLVCNDGGVHGPGSVDCTSALVNAGDHNLEVFYDDLNTTGAVLDFTVDTAGVTTNPAPLPSSSAPEPDTIALMVIGMVCMLVIAPRRQFLVPRLRFFLPFAAHSR